MTAKFTFRPSSFHRTMACPGSARAEARVAEPEPESPYATEGTAAHAFAAYCLDWDIRDPHELVGKEVGELDAEAPHVKVNKQMANAIAEYLHALDGKDVITEKRVDLGDLYPGMSGTADAIVQSRDGTVPEVHDLKYGRGVRVDATNNAQLMLYALGAGFRDGARLFIHQPRLDHVSEWEASAAVLSEFRINALRAIEAAQEPDAPRTAGSHCKFCRAIPGCETHAQYVTEQTELGNDEVAAMFDDETDKPNLELILPRLAELSAWIEHMRAAAHRALEVDPDAIPGWKLVRGRRSRSWHDAEAAKKALRGMKFAIDEVAPRHVITPAAAQTLIESGPHVERRERKLEKLTKWSVGKPVLAPVDDPRPALDPLFEDESQTGDPK